MSKTIWFTNLKRGIKPFKMVQSGLTWHRSLLGLPPYCRAWPPSVRDPLPLTPSSHFSFPISPPFICRPVEAVKKPARSRPPITAVSSWADPWMILGPEKALLFFHGRAAFRDAAINWQVYRHWFSRPFLMQCCLKDRKVTAVQCSL